MCDTYIYTTYIHIHACLATHNISTCVQHICIYALIHIFIAYKDRCIHTYVQTHGCVCIDSDIHACSSTYIHTYLHANMLAYNHECLATQILHRFIHAYICIHTYTHIYINIHECLPTYKHVLHAYNIYVCLHSYIYVCDM